MFESEGSDEEEIEVHRPQSGIDVDDIIIESDEEVADDAEAETITASEYSHHCSIHTVTIYQ